MGLITRNNTCLWLKFAHQCLNKFFSTKEKQIKDTYGVTTQFRHINMSKIIKVMILNFVIAQKIR